MDGRTNIITNQWTVVLTRGNYTFTGGVFDGNSLWMVPRTADAVVKVSTSTGAMTLYNGWPAGLNRGGAAFYGGVFDGSSVWMVPFTADAVVRVSTSTGTMTMYNGWPAGLTRGGAAFYGGVFDGSSVWMVPNMADGAVKVTTSTGTMTLYNGWPAGLTRGSFAFAGGVFDGSSVWLVPRTADAVVKLFAISDSEPRTQTRSATGHPNEPSKRSYARRRPATKRRHTEEPAATPHHSHGSSEASSMLHFGALQNNPDIIWKAIEWGCPTELVNAEDKTALYAAVEAITAFPTIKLHFAFEGETALFVAVRRKHADIARLLLTAKCVPKILNRDGDTALHVAVQLANLEMVQVLIDNGCNRDVVNANKRTPTLHRGHGRKHTIDPAAAGQEL